MNTKAPLEGHIILVFTTPVWHADESDPLDDSGMDYQDVTGNTTDGGSSGAVAHGSHKDGVEDWADTESDDDMSDGEGDEDKADTRGR